MLAGTRAKSRLSLGREIAIDLGTANTRVYVRGEGLVLDEPSIVAVRDSDGQILAAGAEAKAMVGRTPHGISVIRPVSHGVITHDDACERMLRYFVQSAHGRSLLSRPRMVLCMPSHLTGVEQRAVREAGYAAGARQVYLLESPLATAIGAGVPIHEPTGHVVVDIGAGHSQVAVVALGGIVSVDSIRTGGDDMDQAIVKYLAEHYDLNIGLATAEQIKIGIGSAHPVAGLAPMPVRGQDVRTGLPKQIDLSDGQVRKALQPVVDALMAMIRRALEKTPAEVSGDLVGSGVVVSGGASALRGLPDRLAHELGISVRAIDPPGEVVVDGAGVCVENFAALKHVLLRDPAY